jgi:hypothetical protein
MALISHTNTVSIPANRTLKVQLLFDLTPTMREFGVDDGGAGGRVLVTDWVSLYVEGRPHRTVTKEKAYLVGMGVGWALVAVVLVLVLGWLVRRRRQGKRASGQTEADPVGMADHLPIASDSGVGVNAGPSPWMSSFSASSAPSLPQGAAVPSRGGLYAAANPAYISPGVG